MSVNKPTSAQLTEWEALLEAEGLAPIESDPRSVQLEDTHGVRIPAQPVREGGIFWHKRADIFHSKQDRNRREPVRFICPVCLATVESRKGSRFCSGRCRLINFRAVKRNAKLTKKGEETNQ